MTALEAFRRFQDIRRTGEFDRIRQVIDVKNYVENCVGFTGWTLGFDIALANFENGIRATFSDVVTDEQDCRRRWDDPSRPIACTGDAFGEAVPRHPSE